MPWWQRHLSGRRGLRTGPLPLRPDGALTGSSTNGTPSPAPAARAKTLDYTITTAEGKTISNTTNVLPRLTPAELAAMGLAPATAQFVTVANQPDEYVAVLSPGGASWLGRSGGVRKGESGTNIIGFGCADQ